MRSRTMREGSVGLLILLGLGILGGLILWLRGFQPGRRSYIATIEFPDVAGMTVGAPVRYRGAAAGKITQVSPGANGVQVEIQFSPATLVIPKNSTIQVFQSGLIGETSVEITPNGNLPDEVVAGDPLAPDCNRDLIICNGDRLGGGVGVSFTQLIGSLTRFTDTFSNPLFFAELRQLTRNSSDAAAGVATLTREFTELTQAVEIELGQLSASATSTSGSIASAANEFSATATQLGLTAAQVSALVNENRSTLVQTLNSISRTSSQLETTLGGLSPTLNGIQDGQLVENLQTLSANAAQASINLRNLTESVGSTENLLLLQQTLDSARATFQNTQKITADLDELTGDPGLRDNIRSLIDGLSQLLSSTQQLHQQAALAQALNQQAASPPPIGNPQQALPSPAARSSPAAAPPIEQAAPEPTVLPSPYPSSAGHSAPELAREQPNAESRPQ